MYVCMLTYSCSIKIPWYGGTNIQLHTNRKCWYGSNWQLKKKRFNFLSIHPCSGLNWSTLHIPDTIQFLIRKNLDRLWSCSRKYVRIKYQMHGFSKGWIRDNTGYFLYIYNIQSNCSLAHKFLYPISSISVTRYCLISTQNQIHM
jgi:hypothetical protein